jgi:hypothetical protein
MKGMQMLKDIADTIKGIVQVAASLLQLTILIAVIYGGWWVYSSVSEFLKKPVTLPFPGIQAPEFPKWEMPDFGLRTFRKEPKPDPNQPWMLGPAPDAPKAPPGAWSFDNP